MSDRMPHPLNQAVITQALHDLHNGRLHGCLAMGFGERDLEALKQPALVALLVNARVPWCTVQVNQEILRRLISQADDIAREISAVDRMLRLGASTEMISRYHGLTHQEIALRREVIGLPGHKGRHPVLSEEQEAELWHAWKAAVAERGVALGDEKAMLGLAMDLAEALAVSLAVVWTTIQNWIAQGLTGE